MISGKKLLEEAEKVYEWYGQWIGDYPRNFHYLSILIQLSKVSEEGGNFISKAQEEGAIQKLDKLKEQLYSGKIRHSEFGWELNSIIEVITSANPKAKLVYQSKKLEYVIGTRPDFQDTVEKCKEVFRYILARVSPKLPDINAMALAQEFALIITKIKNGLLKPLELLGYLETAMKGWLPV